MIRQFSLSFLGILQTHTIMLCAVDY